MVPAMESDSDENVAFHQGRLEIHFSLRYLVPSWVQVKDKVILRWTKIKPGAQTARADVRLAGIIRYQNCQKLPIAIWGRHQEIYTVRICVGCAPRGRPIGGKLLGKLENPLFFANGASNGKINRKRKEIFEIPLFLDRSFEKHIIHIQLQWTKSFPAMFDQRKGIRQNCDACQRSEDGTGCWIVSCRKRSAVLKGSGHDLIWINRLIHICMYIIYIYVHTYIICANIFNMQIYIYILWYIYI